MPNPLPAINQSFCHGWNEQDVNTFNRYPFYFAKLQAEMNEFQSVFTPLLGSIPWTPNMGSTIKGVIQTRSANIRQTFYPNPLCDLPKTDIYSTFERTVNGVLYGHNHESPIFNFCPSFTDFHNDHVSMAAEDIVAKQVRDKDLFARSYIFNQSPAVCLPDRTSTASAIGFGNSVMAAPTGIGNDAGTSGKTNAWLASVLPQIGSPGNLSLNAVNLALTYLCEDAAIKPFSGPQTARGDNPLVNSRYLLITSQEAYTQWIYDPWLQAHKTVDLNITNAPYQGNLFGRITCRLEQFPLRIAVDNTGAVSFPAPEVQVLSGENAGEAIPNPAYVQAQYEVAWLFGMGKGEAYKQLRVGPPPKDFASNKAPAGFGKMTWNGELTMTTNILVPCLDADGNVTQTTNKYGKYLQLISFTNYGMLAVQPRAVLPIIFKRQRGAEGPVVGYSVTT